MRTILCSLILAGGMWGQDAPAPNPTLPIAVAGFATFNQLSTPRWTGGFSAIYPVVGSWGVYGTTTTDIAPKKAMDPGTGREFYALSASVRQGVHRSVLSSGRLTFLLGGDLGPGFSQGQPSGISVSVDGSFVVTALYRLSNAFSVIAPVRMLYVSNIGWNPVAEIGVCVRLGALPK